MTSTFQSVLNQYEKNKNASFGNENRVSMEERMKKYFVTILPKGEKDGQRRIRILPTADGSSPFVEVKFHEIQVDGKWVKLYDPAQEGKRSPLNEVYEGLNMSGSEEDRDLARQYRSRKFYIVKVIDRDHEQDGVKFWRFKHNAKGEGIFDKIFPIFKNKGDITDPKAGRDLILSLSLTKSGNGKEYTTINSIMYEDPTPLHEDQKIADEWVKDDLVWSDVYATKGEDYLDMVARGENPRWDPETKKYVSNEEGVTVISSSKPKKPKSPPVVDPQADDVEDDDLPF